MAQATRSIVVDVTPDQFMEVVTAYERYPDFLPEVKKITVTNRTATTADVTYEVDVIKRVNYTIRLVRDGYKVTWTMLSSNVFKKNDGGWTLRPEGSGRTHATYGLEVGFAGIIPVPSAITNALTETSLPGMLERFKKRAESLFPMAA